MASEFQRALKAMEAEMRASSSLYQPAQIWERLNELHGSQLDDLGFESFKQTINQSYFNFVLGIRNPQVRALGTWWIHHPTLAIAKARVEGWESFEDQRRSNPLRSRRRRILYASAVATLWEFARSQDRLRLLDTLQEPDLGHPVVVRYRGRRISQDIANSVIELYSIAGATGSLEPGRGGVIELGAGYGRLGWLYLSAFSRVRYTIVDIPPALAISQEYLSRQFPGRSTFRFRHFDDYGSVAAEFEAAQIVFLTPNQLELLPPQGAAVFINISSLHEMRPDQVANYLRLIGVHTSGVFYTKQWWTWENPDDGITVGHPDYPIPTEWTQAFLRSHQVNPLLFEAAYHVSVETSSS